MGEKICPATDEKCLAGCDENGLCYIQRIVPIVRERVVDALHEECRNFSKLDSLPPDKKTELRIAIRKAATKTPL